MASFLILLLAAGFVVVCIWLLGKNQHRRLLDSVERSTPLSPLQGQTLPDFGAAAHPAPAFPLMSDLLTSSTAGVPFVTAGDTSGLGDTLRAPRDDCEPERRDTPAAAGDASELSSAADAPVSASGDKWLARVRALREADDPDEALALCRSYAPRVQAFQQAAIILRSQIREQADQGLPADALLHDLYRTAVLADVFRNTNPARPADPESTLTTLLGQDFPYQQIGHRELKLLKKSDIRLLEQAWGAPAMHQHAEAVLRTGV